MKFKLSKYIIPSIIAMVVVGTNANIDGFFIGNILGDDGLAAINIAWPIVAFIASMGTGIGVGGSVILNRIRGEGDSDTAESIKNTTLIFLTVIGLVTGLILCLCSSPVLKFMGAEGQVLKHAYDYSIVISIGAVFQILASGLLVLLRNDHKTYQSMIYSLIGLVLHIIFDFLWAEKFVMYGVAAATVVSQGVIMILSLISLSIDRSKKINIKHLSDIIKDSTAPFGINFVPSLVLFFTNIFALKCGGVSAVSAYAAMSYAVYTFDYIFQGMCDGIQPIISYCRGSNDKQEEMRAVKSAGIILAVFSGVCILSTLLLIKLLPAALAVSEEASQIVSRGFMFYAVSYPFKAAVKFICSYHYATGNRKLSNILVYLDPLVFTPGLLVLLTALFKLDGVWLAMTLCQIILTIIGLVVTKKVINKQ